MEEIREQINKKNEIDSSTMLLDVLFQYLRHWKWFVISIIVSLIIATGFVLITPKSYVSSLSILLKEDQGAKGASLDYDLDMLGLLNTTNNIENEIVVLGSPDLMEMVVDALKLNVSYSQRKFMREVEIYKETPFEVNVVEGLVDFQGNCEFFIKKTSEGYQIEGVYISPENEELPIKLLEKALPDTLKFNESIVLAIKPTGKEVISDEKYYVNVISESKAAGKFTSKLSVTNATPKSSVLNLSLTVNNQEKGADVLNEIVKQYNDLNLRVNNEIAYNTALFINERLKEISIELSDAEEEVVDYKQRHSITDLSTEAQLFVSQTGENEQRLLEIETQLNVLALIQNFIDNPANREKIIPNMGVSDIGLSEIISQYNNKLLATDQLLKGTGEENPARLRVLEELGNMRNGISNSLANVKETYTVSKKDLDRRALTNQSRVRSVPKQEKGLIEKVREQKIKENLFLFLMQKREETNLSIAGTSGKARIVISPRMNLLPVAPKKPVIFLAALLLGILIPVIIIYLRNLFKINIESRDEFERLTSVPIMGEIAVNDTNDTIVATKHQNTLSEMFRSLRNNIKFASSKKTGVALMVTSTISGEGKSFVSLNLALSFAKTKKKILLIGGDIRNPKLLEYLGVHSGSRRGLSDYLVTENIDWNDYLITPFEDLENFQVLVAGTIPPNPNELLMNSSLSELIESAQGKYDYVIIDSAPVGLVSDSYLINEYVDLTLYVVRENKTPKAAVNFLNIQKDENKLKNLYVVMNGTKLTNSYKYGYGKDYGYKSTSKK